MTYREPDHEALIVQKLRDMEDFLKLFMAKLGEPPKRKGGGSARKIEARYRGEILWSNDVWDGKIVEKGEFLCIIKYGDGPWQFERVFSPADGTLIMEVKRGMVDIGTHIATIETDVLV